MSLKQLLVRCSITLYFTGLLCVYYDSFLLKVFPLFRLEVGVYFTSGLSDVTAIIGTDAELVCRLSNEECDGVWYKEGKEVRRTKVKLVETSPFKILMLW